MVSKQFALAMRVMEYNRSNWSYNHYSGKTISNIWTGNSYGGPGGDNALHGYICDNDDLNLANLSQFSFRSYPCHKHIQEAERAIAYWSCFGSSCDKRITDRYFKWLCFESPWARGSNIVPDLSVDFMREVGFVWDSLDQISGNLLHNFLIATRSAAEWKGFIDLWYVLITEHKINLDLAYYFLTQFYTIDTNGDNRTSWGTTPESLGKWPSVDKYDWPLDTVAGDEQYLQNFVSAKMPGLSTIMFYPSAVTKPVNTLWGNTTKADWTGNKSAGPYMVFLKETYSDRTDREYSVRRYNPLKGNHVNEPVKCFSVSAMIGIIKDEQKRLGL